MLDITLIGCGGTMPLPNRALSALAVSCGGRVVLFDCGEGTQAAARRAGVSLYKIDAICLTHYHGDHIFGLPGLLQTMASLGRTAPVTVFGPVGLTETMKLVLTLCRGLPFSLKLCEVCTAAPGQSVPLGGAAGRDALLDGWNVPATLTAFRLTHRVPCCGYRFELARAGRFLPEKARALDVAQTDWKRLQRGETVTNAAGETVTPDAVLGAPRRGLSVVFGTDTRPCEALERAAAGADLLLTDSTYPESAQQDKAEEFGHSTFAESAALAARAGAKRLWLTHYSASIEDPTAFLCEAQRFFPTAEAGFDGKTLSLRFEE